MSFSLSNIVSPNPNFNATLAQAHAIQGFLTAFGVTNALCFAETNPSSDPPVEAVCIPESLQATKNIPFLDTTDGSLQTNGVSDVVLINVLVVADGINPQNVALIIRNFFVAHQGDPVSQLNALAAGLGQGVSDANVLAALLSIANAKAAVAQAINSALGLS